MASAVAGWERLPSTWATSPCSLAGRGRHVVKAESIMTSPVITVRPSISIKQAGRVLIDNEISAAPVVDATGRLVGIVTEADVMRLETEDDPRDRVRRSEAADPYVPVTVGEIMSRNVLAVQPETDAGEIARLMLEQQVKCVPIVRGDKVVGVVSRRDLLRALVRRDQDIRADLESLLLEEPETYGRWSVEVEDGVVTLVGPPDRFHRRLAGIVSHTVPGRPKAHAQHPGHGVRDDAGEPTAEAVRRAYQGDHPVLDLDRPAAVGLRLLQQQRLQISPDVLVPTYQRAQQVASADHPDHLVAVHDRHALDLLLEHQPGDLASVGLRRYGEHVPRHDLADGHRDVGVGRLAAADPVSRVVLGLQPHDIGLGDDTDQPAGVVDNRGRTDLIVDQHPTGLLDADRRPYSDHWRRHDAFGLHDVPPSTGQRTRAGRPC